MKQIPSNRLPAIFFLLFTFPVLLFGCATVAERSSPWSIGYGFNTMPGWYLGAGNSSLHAVLGYHRLPYPNGSGKTDFLQTGLQFRYTLSDPAKGPWVGLEASYSHVTDKPDNFTNSSASGFTVGPAGGYRFNAGRVPLNAYLVPAFQKLGNFKQNGNTIYQGGSGLFIKLGMDIPFMTLLSAKGR